MDRDKNYGTKGVHNNGMQYPVAVRPSLVELGAGSHSRTESHSNTANGRPFCYVPASVTCSLGTLLWQVLRVAQTINAEIGS
jgi:hypothetical protein